jgi:hypothetical protein
MAGDWIPIRVRLEEDLDVLGIAEALELDVHAVVGKLITFWGWANEMSHDGHMSLSRSVRDTCRASVALSEWIDRKVGAQGFAQALLNVGWLKSYEGGFVVYDFDRWNSENARKRLKNADRQRRVRAGKCRASGATNVARKARPKKRREEKSKKKTTSSSPLTPQRAWELACSFMRGDALKTEIFREAWVGWVECRKKQKDRPYTEHAMDLQIRKLEAWGHGNAVTACDRATDGGWKGLHDPREQRDFGGGQSQGAGAKPKRKPTAAERGEYPQPDAELPSL